MSVCVVQMRHFCHSFKFFLCTNNPKSQPRRSLSYLSMNSVSLTPIKLKKKCRLPKVNLFMSSNHIFFHFPLSFLLPHLKKGSYAFQGLTCHSPLDFESIPVLLPQTLHPSTLTFLSDHSFHVYLPQTQAMIAWLSLFNSLKD